MTPCLTTTTSVLSKRLSLVLRHRPDSVGLTLDANGWVDVETLLWALRDHGTSLTREGLDGIVQQSDKQRFEWDVAVDRIRARQGHSVTVDLDLEPSTPPAVLFHGTPRRNVNSILATGLDKRRRHHVHLSPDEATAVLCVDAAAMAAAGHQFWQSTNGVWLCDAVPPEFVSLPT